MQQILVMKVSSLSYHFSSVYHCFLIHSLKINVHVRYVASICVKEVLLELTPGSGTVVVI